MHTTDLTETQLIDRLRPGLQLGPDARAVALSALGHIFEVSGGRERYIVRLPRDKAHLATLRREARIAAALQGRVSLRIPDTQVVEDPSGRLTFAVHTRIPGEPLVTEDYTQSSPTARERLVADLALFFRQMHGISLEQACGWLNIACKTGDPAAELAPRLGIPTWFGPEAAAEIRSSLGPVLDEETRAILQQTVASFEALEPRPEYMVFGHGDLHGYNAAVGRDDLGPKLVGVFDLENTGILDIHEDFFRLSLVSEPMLEDVLRAYQRMPGPSQTIDRARIAVYYRAFLFYLMVGKTGEPLVHLQRLLAQHLTC